MSESNPSAVRVSALTGKIALLTIDQPAKSANVLSASMFDDLEAAMLPLLERSDLEGLVVVSAKPRIFVAGADLNAIVAGLDWPDERIIAFCERGREVMGLFHRAPFVTVAAIHGACVGGGFELALWCDRRILSRDRRSVVGLPEVKLGLIPGWAGTVRVARRADLETQLDLVTSGRLVGGTEALEMQLVDDLADPEALQQVACDWIEKDWASGNLAAHRAACDRPLDRPDVEGLTRRFTEKITRPDHPIYPVAPLIALEHMLRSAELPLDEACRSESRAFAEAWGSEPSYGLLHHFFLSEYNRKHPGWDGDLSAASPIEKVGVVGAGLMGSAIARANAGRGKQVWIFDAQPERAAAVVAEFEGEGITATDDLRPFRELGLAIETVTESPAIKLGVLAEIERAVSPATVIATNTSAIPVGQLATALSDPSRFCGIHFCHPELMSLVEIIPGPETASETIATALSYVRSLGKLALVVRDRAGFAVNRLLATLLKGGFDLLVEGVPVPQIDAAMREFGFRAGPFEIIDVIGADTCVHAGRVMWQDGLRCVTSSPILPRMVKLGRLGRKTGRGFYRYAEPRSAPEWDPGLEEVLAPYQEPTGAAPADPAGLAAAILEPMVAEGKKMLEEGVVADPRDLDLATIHGFTFPEYRGGLMYWASRNGF